MKRNVSIRPFAIFNSLLLICLTSMLIISACRKVDKTAELPPPPKAINITEKFFTIPATTNPVVKTIAQSIYRQNEKGKFVEELVKKIGYPNWAKSIVATPSGLIQTEDEDSSYNQIIYLPFALSDSNSTSAVLVVGEMPTDTIYSLVYPQHYQQYGFDTTAAGWNARNVFQLFTEFDYMIFGYTTFKVTDGRIFGYNEEDTLKVTRQEQAGNRTGIQGDSFIEVCGSYTVTKECPKKGFRVGVSSENNIVECEPTVSVVTVCNTFWFGDDPGPLPGDGGGSGGSGGGPGSGGTGGGGTGGGGNGGGSIGWPDTPPCPILPRTFVTESGNFIPCPTGWVPVPDPLTQLQKEWDDKIIIDYTVRPCIENIINQIKGIESGTIAKIICELSGNLPGFDWEIQEVATIPSNPNLDAQTDCSPNGTISHSITYLNSAKLQNATNISIARTIIHESVHAFLYDYFYYNTNLSQPERDNILGLPYSQMLKQYLRHSKPLQGNSEHNLMANTFRKDIAEALKKLCPILGINLTGYELDQFCDDMSWGGLHDDDNSDSPWNELSGSEKARITKRIDIELNNLPGFSGIVPDPTPGSQLSFPVSLTKAGTKACQ